MENFPFGRRQSKMRKAGNRSRELDHLLVPNMPVISIMQNNLGLVAFPQITYKSLPMGAANFEAGNSIYLPWIMEGS